MEEMIAHVDENQRESLPGEPEEKEPPAMNTQLGVSSKRSVRWLESVPRIISASRRTDIPAYYGDWFMNRLEQGFAGYGTGYGVAKFLVSLKPEHVVCFVFWSKNFAPFIENLRTVKDKGYDCLCHFTITGLPKDFEPNVPDSETAVRTLREMSRILSPDQIFWRYDPIVISNVTGAEYHREAFTRIAAGLEGYVRRCYFSFPVHYGKVRRNSARFKEEKGITIEAPGIETQVALANELAEIAGHYGITMHSCCGEYLVGGKIQKAHCVDGQIISDLFSGGRQFKDKPTRKECGCAESTDIGAYDTCVHGCIYCYANMNKERAESSFAIHESDSVFLASSKKESDRWIQEAKETPSLSQDMMMFSLSGKTS